jgi:hypothetical protein
MTSDGMDDDQPQRAMVGATRRGHFASFLGVRIPCLRILP